MGRSPTRQVFFERVFWVVTAAAATAVLCIRPESQPDSRQAEIGDLGHGQFLNFTDARLPSLWNLNWGVNLATAAVATLVYSLCRAVLVPSRARSKSYHDPKNPKFKALRAKFFPPGYPNGWHCVCNASDVEGGRVHSISALGTHMVAFRGEDSGVVGVLDAFCPHLGAHLGSGGTVEGDALKCPFHGWEFATTGQCTHIPYSRLEAVPPRAKTKAYEVREVLERVYVWFDAEGRPPQWEMACHEDLASGVASGEWYLGATRTLEFEQHSCEMMLNSADPYHFQTLHAPLPLPILDHVITAFHTIKQFYGSGVVNGAVTEKEWLASITEKTTGLFLFGKSWLPIPFSATSAGAVGVGVTFEGPTIMHFTIATPFGKLRQVKTVLPVEPFKQFVESRWYAERHVPMLLVRFFALLGVRALEQDRQVWENKLYRDKPMLVSGDGPFPAFFRWQAQFYSESSAALSEHSLDW